MLKVGQDLGWLFVHSSEHLEFLTVVTAFCLSQSPQHKYHYICLACSTDNYCPRWDIIPDISLFPPRNLIPWFHLIYTLKFVAVVVLRDGETTEYERLDPCMLRAWAKAKQKKEEQHRMMLWLTEKVFVTEITAK